MAAISASFIGIFYHLREITILFTCFLSLQKISENTERRRKRASEQLRAHLSTGKARGERRLYIEFSRDSDHSNHFVGQVWLFNK